MSKWKGEVITGTKKEKSKTGYVSEKTMYRCDNCAGCPYRDNCTKAKEAKTLAVSHKFYEMRKQLQEKIQPNLAFNGE